MSLKVSEQKEKGNDFLEFNESKLKSIAPGLDRALHFENGSGVTGKFKITKHINHESKILDTFTKMDLKGDYHVKQSTDDIVLDEIKDVDTILPSDLTLRSNVVKPTSFSPIAREWAHLIDVNQPFDEFHSLVN
jgi:hypothetical protein